MTLSSLHLVFQVCGSVVEALTSICQLSASSSQEVRVCRIGTSTARHECILVNLLVSSFGSALVIVLVAGAANTAHIDSAHSWNRNGTI